MKNILLIHPEGNINNNPNLTGIVEVLCESGYAVEIVSPRRPEISQKPPCAGATIRLIDVVDFGSALYFSFAIPQGMFEKPDLLHTYLNQTFGKTDFIFGVDRGIFDAFVISNALGIPYGLISYEIYSAEETGKEFKEPEILACRGISLAVCQDRIRASLLSRENHIPSDLVFHIPASGRGFRPSAGRTFEIHDRLGLGRDIKIALYMGSITSPWSMTGELLTTIPDWPDDWVLLLHHRYGMEQVFQRFPFLKDSKTIIPSSFQQLDYHELPKILHHVDLGLAFYVPQKTGFEDGNNLRYIGMASGKIATYLQHGLPVMVNESGLLSDTVKKFNIGCVVKNAPEVPAGLKNLTAEKLGEYRNGIRPFFETELDLNITVRPLLKRLNELLERAGAASSRPAESPEDLSSEAPLHSDTRGGAEMKVSAIVSTYNSERFIRGCLEDLVNQTLYQKGELEIIVADSGSQQNEKAIVEEFRQKYKNIFSLRTGARETVYAAWNKGIKAASGKYITNANTDDRHRKDALEVMARTLDQNPGIGLVYADVIITETENETFDKHTPAGAYQWLEYDREKLSLGCYMGPQPMWRRSLHDKYGYFAEAFSSSGDWEFWLRIAEDTLFLHIPEFLGLYLRSPNSLEHQNAGQRIKEDRTVYKTYIPKYLPAYEEYFTRLLGPGLSDRLNVYRYGQILAAFDRYDEAIRLYASYAQKNPKDEGFNFLLSDLKNLQAQHGATQASPPARLPDEVMFYVNQADRHIADKDHASAREAIKQALRYTSEHPQLTAMLSHMLANLGPPEAGDGFSGTKRKDR